MIRIAGLTHTYRSVWSRMPAVRALDDVSLEMTAGSAVGIIGVNGAGKTTLLRVLLGYLRPTAGSVEIEGLPPRPYVERYGIGYVPERVAIPRGWTVEGALQAYALLGNAAEDAPARVEGSLERLGLGEIRTRSLGRLSKGNLQRLAIAQAILCERRLMVLDEPTDGLDPLWVAELRAILSEWRAGDADRVAVIATHNLPLLERVADRVLVLHDGRVIADLDLLGPGDSPPLEETFLRLLRDRGETS
jgi:ABC-type multidrug transport system ATPase subunit